MTTIHREGDLDPGVAEVQCVRVALASVADDRDLPGQEVDIAFTVDCGHGSPSVRV